MESRQIELIRGDESSSLSTRGLDKRAVAVHDHDGQIRIRHCLAAALDAESLHEFAGFANAGCIDDANGNAFEFDGFRDHVARGAGDVGHDGAILLNETIEEAALAYIGLSDDGEGETVVYEISVAEAPHQGVGPGDQWVEPPQNLRWRGDADVVFRKVDARFEQRDQFQQLRLDGREQSRYRTLGLLRRDPRLIERCRFDEVAYRFGARQIDASIEIRPQRELAGFGETRARAHSAIEAMPQDHRCSMAGNFDHIFGGVGFGCGEIRDDYVVYGLLAVMI